uniref:Serpentine receptor class gamma n=1 Tax=Caenorhabditis tropicalis TaxID=1561998 RepID=A0A1I7TSX5_9PELO
MTSTQNLSDYILYNYSKCSPDTSFLASWQGLAYPSHVIQFIGFPFQILTFWLILKKTPESMKSIKNPLMIAHILCTLLDFHFSTLVTPYMFLPSFTYIPIGILGLLRVPVLIQSFFMTETLIGKDCFVRFRN